MKPTVIFLIYHGMGHFNACFKIARILQRDHNVIFAGFEFFKNHVRQHGFQFHSLKTVPFGLGFEPWVNKALEKKKNIYWNVLKDRWTNRLYKLRAAELLDLVSNYNPNYLLIDSWQSTDFIVLYPLLKTRNIKVGFIQTMLSTTLQLDLPPLNSLAFPGNSDQTHQSHKKFLRHQLKQKLLQKAKYFGKDNAALINQKVKTNKLPAEFMPHHKSLFSPAFENVIEFILAPEEFDFPTKHRSPNKKYVGFMTKENRVGETVSDDFIRVQKKMASANLPVVYCSFGSVQYGDHKKIKKFVDKVIQAATREKFFLIIAINSDELIRRINNLPDNVYIFKSVPQLQVLSKANVFINHGGLNSIKEAIAYGVPMLIYPMDTKTDQNGNSTRVVFHEIGLRGDLSTDSSADISQKIKRLLSEKSFHDKIQQIKETEKAYTEQNFLSLFANLKCVE